MKLRFNRAEMAEALTAISSVALARTPKEILRGVRIDAEADVVFLSATDLELSLRCAVTQVEVEQAGTAVVVAETFARIVRECADEILIADMDESQLHVRGAGSHFQIVTQSPADFPPVPMPDGASDFTVEYGALHRLVELTTFAAARESTRYAINGVLWETKGNKLTLAATDGRRLAVARGMLAAAPAQAPPTAIVPTKALALLGRLAIDATMRTAVKITKNQLLLDAGRAKMSTALVEGQFPKYQDVVPTDMDRMAYLNTAEFHSALKRAALLTNEESKGVRFAFAEGGLTMSSRAPEQGEATVAIPVRYEGEPVEIGFNPVFLLEVLRVVHAEEVSFSMKDPNRPGVLRIGDDFTYVIMPVNLSSA